MRVFDKIHKRSFDLSKVKKGLFFDVSIESVAYKEPHSGGFSKEQHSVIILKVSDGSKLISRFEFDYWFSDLDLETLKAYKQGYKLGHKYGTRYVRSLGIKQPFKQTMTDIILDAVELFLSSASIGYSYDDVSEYARDFYILPDGESYTYDEMKDKVKHIEDSFNTCVGYWEELTRALESLELDTDESFDQIREMFQDREGYKVDVPRIMGI